MNRIRRKFFNNSRGFTFIEMMIAISISALLMVTVAGVQFISGRAIKELYGQTRTRSARMMALDQIRYKLYNAKIGTCTYTSGSDTLGYTQIDFLDPNISTTQKSRLYFTSTTNTLYYRKLPSGTATVVAYGPIDVRFLSQNGGSTILVKVKSSSVNAYGNDVDTEDGVVTVYLRNV